jgi:hypothetical protein
VAQILKISSAYTPPPPEGFISPMLWGVEEKVLERFGSAGISPEKLSFSKELWVFHVAYTPVRFVEEFRNYYGPTMNAFEAAEKEGKSAQLQEELEALFTNQNSSALPDQTNIAATYLKVTVQR